jgi:hypothetical protein
VVANVTHTVIAESEITLWLRVPGAVIWPAFTFGGIEVLVRMIWSRSWSHGVTRWVLLSASVPAAITSYQHQNALLQAMGEIGFIQAIGPLAIDGLMIGCTMALLFTRNLPAAPDWQPAPLLEQPAVSDEELEQIVERWTEKPEQLAPASGSFEEQASVLMTGIAGQADAFGHVAAAAFAPVEQELTKLVRAPRAGKPEQEKAVSMMLAGQRQEALDAGLMGASTMRLYEKVARLLRNNPTEEIGPKLDGRSVRADLVEIIRAHANLERSR